MQMSSKLQESLKDVRSDDAPTFSSGADIVGTSRKNTFREGFLCSLSFIHQNFTRTVIKPLHILRYAGDRVEYIGDGSLKLSPRYYC